MKRLPQAFTLIELLIVIGLITIILGLILSSVQSSRAAARAVTCVSTLHQIGQGLVNYSMSNRGVVVPTAPSALATTWWEMVFPSQSRIPLCTTASPDETSSYFANTYLDLRALRFGGRNRWHRPTSEIGWVGENIQGANYLYLPVLWDPTSVVYATERHGHQRGSNYLWLDAHVSSSAAGKRKGMSTEWDVPTDEQGH